jgi:hypothetical protein
MEHLSSGYDYKGTELKAWETWGEIWWEAEIQARKEARSKGL